jgi:hypothetical protein
MMEQLQTALSSLAAVDKFRSLIGNALTRPQQLAISVKMQKSPEAFMRFAQSDEGRAAIRQVAETFIEFERE